MNELNTYHSITNKLSRVIPSEYSTVEKVKKETRLALIGTWDNSIGIWMGKNFSCSKELLTSLSLKSESQRSPRTWAVSKILCATHPTDSCSDRFRGMSTFHCNTSMGF